MFGFDLTYFLIAGPGILLGMWASYRVKSTFKKFSRVSTAKGLSGAQIAQEILNTEGIGDVSIEAVQGMLSDHYDPRSKTLRLSPDVYGGASVAAAGVAAHEVGHAVQHARAYPWLGMRSRLVPVLSLTSKLAMPAIMIGMGLMYAASRAGSHSAIGQTILLVGIAMFGALVLFQIVTLPVEFDASKRALVALEKGNIVTQEELGGARKVLRAAALTYVAAAVTSMSQLIYFLLRSGILGGRR